MLRERYTKRNLFEEIEGISLGMEPVLNQLDILDEDEMFGAVKGDVSQRYPKTLVTGRGSTPVEVLLRMLVVKHLYGWSYEQTEQWVNDSLVLRQFCRVYLEKVPDDTTLIGWAKLIQPMTLQGLLDHVVELARRLKVTKGRKLRIDGTVVETTIHHPTDSTLLQDGVRILGRIIGLGVSCRVGERGARLGCASRHKRLATPGSTLFTPLSGAGRKRKPR